MKIEVTQSELDQISAYILAKKGIEVKVLPPSNTKQLLLYSIAFSVSNNYFKGGFV